LLRPRKTEEDRATQIARIFCAALTQWYEAAQNVSNVTKEELANGFSKGLKEFGMLQKVKLQEEGKQEKSKPGN
jgi:hypothetical protein